MTYKKLEVYKLSYKTALELHNILIDKKRNKNNLFSLLDQISRSTKSIPANIAEGNGKSIYKNEFKKFL